jgi:hypothetical protein
MKKIRKDDDLYLQLSLDLVFNLSSHDHLSQNWMRVEHARDMIMFIILYLENSWFSVLMSSLTMMKKKHSIYLFKSCRWCFFVRSWDFLFRSQIIYVLHLTFNLDFLIRFKTTAYSSWLTCSFRYLRRSFKFSKMRASERENRFIATRTLIRWIRRKNERDETKNAKFWKCELACLLKSRQTRCKQDHLTRFD